MRSIMKSKIICNFALCMLLFLSCDNNTQYQVIENDFSKEASHIISHRGSGSEELEHTYVAYDLALLYGSKNIELDVVVSADGTLWVSHDLTAKRITGIDKAYLDMTDEEISNLKTIASGESIHKAQEVLDKYGANIYYTIELMDRGG